jgi:hypothetical protein
MTPEQEQAKQLFEEELVKYSVAEYYEYVDSKGLVRSEEDAKMFYEVYRKGVFAGMNYANNKFMESIKNFEDKRKEERNGTEQS